MNDRRPVSAALPPALVAALSGFAAGAQLLRCAPAATSLKMGRTNQTWRVTGGGRDWAVRLGGDDPRLGIDRHAEACVLQRVAAAGFCPPLVSVEPGRGVLVSEFVASPLPEAALAGSGAFAHRVGARLRALHALTPPAGAALFELPEVLAHYAELAPPADAPLARPALLSLLRRHLLRYQPAAVALCHHDLHRDNLLCSEPLLLIDWEFAAYGDPLLDLAAYAAYEQLDEAATAALLDGYGPGPGVEPRALRRARILFDCLRALWLDAARAWDDVPAPARAALCARLAEPS